MLVMGAIGAAAGRKKQVKTAKKRLLPYPFPSEQENTGRNRSNTPSPLSFYYKIGRKRQKTAKTPFTFIKPSVRQKQEVPAKKSPLPYPFTSEQENTGRRQQNRGAPLSFEGHSQKQEKTAKKRAYPYPFKPQAEEKGRKHRKTAPPLSFGGGRQKQEENAKKRACFYPFKRRKKQASSAKKRA